MKILPVSNFAFTRNSNTSNIQKNQMNNNVSNNILMRNLKSAPCDTVSFKSASKKAKAVMDYVAKGCPVSEETQKLFYKMFDNELSIGLYENLPSIKSALEKCGDNLELTKMALGNYGLEAYAGLPAGSTIKNARKGLIETGYDTEVLVNMEKNLINYVGYNPKGNVSEVSERFGITASETLSGRMEHVLDFGIFGSYKPIKGNEEMIEQVVKSTRDNAVRDYLDRNYPTNIHTETI